ncbi:hypothetical protein SMMN14_08758 [Sphaerulina musiva]
MSGLGHFPATENPKVFVGYLLQAIDHIPKEQLVLRSVHSAASSQK